MKNFYDSVTDNSWNHGKALASYSANIFEKFNALNKELQQINMTLVNSKAKIFGFISFLELSQENISVNKFE